MPVGARPPPLPASQRKPALPPEPRPSEPGDDATSIMNRPQMDARIRTAQQAPIARARPAVDLVPTAQRTGHERTAVLPHNAPARPPPTRTASPSQLGPPPAAPTERGRPAPESVGAIALPRPPVQSPLGGTGGMSRPPVSQRTAPVPPGTVRTTAGVPRKTSSLPGTPSFGSNPPPRSADPPPLDDLVPRSRTDRPRHTRPAVSHRQQPARDRPRFVDRSPDPRPPGGGLPGPDSFGRLPAPVPRYEPMVGDFPNPSQFPPGPDETLAMARGPYAAPTPPAPNTAEYYPHAHPPPQARSYAPPPADPYRDQRDPNEYYPHLSPSQRPPPHLANPSAGYDQYPPPGYLAPGDPRGRTMPGPMLPQPVAPPSMAPALVPSRLPVPGSAPYPYVAPPTESPTFMGLVLFAAPLALATLAVALLALM